MIHSWAAALSLWSLSHMLLYTWKLLNAQNCFKYSISDNRSFVYKWQDSELKILFFTLWLALKTLRQLLWYNNMPRQLVSSPLQTITGFNLETSNVCTLESWLYAGFDLWNRPAKSSVSQLQARSEDKLLWGLSLTGPTRKTCGLTLGGLVWP